MAALVVGGGLLLSRMLPTLIAFAENTVYLSVMLAALAGVIYIVLDPRTRNLVWYMYKSVMRWITGLFVKIDPISILKSYIEDMEDNLRKLSKQIGALRGQMRQLKGIMDGNNTEIQKNMGIANQAKKKDDEKSLTLAARKAARLQDANEKYEVLHKKMDVLYRILTKMYENSEIVLEDTKDQVNVKEQEYKAIRASHSAIRSAMSILSGDPDKRAIFDQAIEAIADDVSIKVGEMERFMDTSRHLMDTIDLQNGVFEEDGMRLLEQWEKESPLLTLKTTAAPKSDAKLDLSQPPKTIQKESNDYDTMFD